MEAIDFATPKTIDEAVKLVASKGSLANPAPHVSLLLGYLNTGLLFDVRNGLWVQSVVATPWSRQAGRKMPTAIVKL